jgi:galactokinase
VSLATAAALLDTPRGRGSADGVLDPSGTAVDEARRRFAESFGAAPAVVTIAPGRVNLIGEHTDYNGGFVLPMPIDRFTAVAAARRAKGPSRILSTAEEGIVTVDLAGALAARPPGAPGAWANLVIGVADALRRRGATPIEADLAIAGSVPIGAGLSSSASLAVAAAEALERLAGFVQPPLERARCGQEAEHRFAGTPCGLMDQLAIVFGRRGEATLIDCRSLAMRRVPLPAGAAIIVADSGVRRSLADGAYAERRAACAEAAAQLGVPSLRDARRTDLPGLPAPLRAVAEHVVDENRRTLRAAAMLRRGDLSRAGALMFESHASLRDLFRVSCPELDAIVECAARCRDAGRGVFGARMTGAGFGGCAIVLCAGGDAAEIAAALPATATFTQP